MHVHKTLDLSRTQSFANKQPTWLPESASSFRARAARVETSQFFEAAMCFIIVTNVFFIILQADTAAECVWDNRSGVECKKEWHRAVDYGYLCVYTVEAIFRLMVERCHYFESKWNLFDALIVTLGFAEIVVGKIIAQIPGPSLSILRTFRVLRLMRAVRVIKIFPELYTMLRGFLGAMRSMFWGFVLILVLLTIWSILCVEVLNPINAKLDDHANEWCEEVFASVWNCMLFFFQTLVAGDSWGACTLPIIQKSKLAFMMFGLSLVSVQLGFMNLILAVIVENATRFHEEDLQAELLQKAEKSKKAASKLKDLIRAIDVDESGTISWAELLSGFENNQELRLTMMTLDIDQADLHILFDLMDEENTGELRYENLADNINMAISSDTRKQLMMMRLQSQEVSRAIKMLTQLRKDVELMTEDPDAFRTSLGSRRTVATTLSRATVSAQRVSNRSCGTISHASSLQGANYISEDTTAREKFTDKTSLPSVQFDELNTICEDEWPNCSDTPRQRVSVTSDPHVFTSMQQCLQDHMTRLSERLADDFDLLESQLSDILHAAAGLPTALQNGSGTQDAPVSPGGSTELNGSFRPARQGTGVFPREGRSMRVLASELIGGASRIRRPRTPPYSPPSLRGFDPPPKDLND